MSASAALLTLGLKLPVVNGSHAAAGIEWHGSGVGRGYGVGRGRGVGVGLGSGVRLTACTCGESPSEARTTSASVR